MALDTNLVSYWKLDESSGNASDSVGSNAATNTSVTYSAGKINNGAVFDGVSAKLSVADVAGLSPTGSFSLNCWINVTNYGGDYRGWVGKNTETGNQREYAIGEFTGGTSIIMVVYDNGTGTGVDKTFARPATGGWHMYTMVFTSGSQIEAFLDGASQGTTSTSIVAVDNGTSVFGIGGGLELGGITTSLDGKVDEVGIWSRALTGAEITTLYNSGSGNQYPFAQNLTLTAATGTFVLTGIAANVGYLYRIVASVGEYILTGISATLRFTGWTNQSKNSSTFTNQSKNSSTFTNQTKN